MQVGIFHCSPPPAMQWGITKGVFICIALVPAWLLRVTGTSPLGNGAFIGKKKKNTIVSSQNFLLHVTRHITAIREHPALKRNLPVQSIKPD